MSFRIDVEKSIQKERLIFKPNWESVLEKAFEICIYLGWTIMTIFLLQNPKNSFNLIGIIVTISINILLLISWYYIYKLLKIKTSNLEKDRIVFVDILKERFPELSINDNGVNMLRSKKTNGSLSWGKSLTVFFEENEILINFTTLGRYETKSPLHSISNYLKLKSVEKEFNRKINSV
jgi:hypothetical protein